jgi:hypothetical protein
MPRTGAMGMGAHGSIESFEDKVKQTSQRLAQEGIALHRRRRLDSATMMTAPGRRRPDARRGRFELAGCRNRERRRHAGDGDAVVDHRRALPAQLERPMDGFKKAASDSRQLHAWFYGRNPDNMAHAESERQDPA